MKIGLNYIFLVALMSVVMLVDSCSEEENEIYDYYPICIVVSVEDSNGKDLLNPENGSGIVDNISFVYNGKTYKVGNVYESTRAYAPYWYGLALVEWKDGQYRLMFGEFDGAATYEKETIIIDWGDGTTDELAFSSRITGPGKTERRFYLNGEEIKACAWMKVKFIK